MREAYRPVVIEGVYPELDGGRYPAKRGFGDVFDEGHEKPAAVVKHRRKGRRRRGAVTPTEPLTPGLDRCAFAAVNLDPHEATLCYPPWAARGNEEVRAVEELLLQDERELSRRVRLDLGPDPAEIPRLPAAGTEA